jgi:hypothetical protein
MTFYKPAAVSHASRPSRPAATSWSSS